MSDAHPPLPELTPSPRVDAPTLRRRTVLVGVAIGVALLFTLALATLRPSSAGERPVVLTGPRGTRVAVDGRPQATLGSDGTHLLQLRPGSHELEVTLKGGDVIATEVEIPEGEGSVLLELRFDRVEARWRLVSVNAP